MYKGSDQMRLYEEFPSGRLDPKRLPHSTRFRRKQNLPFPGSNVLNDTVGEYDIE
jgi:hypothetical protein